MMIMIIIIIIISGEGQSLAKQGRKEMFYLTAHSTHFYLRLYDVRHRVNDHSDRKKETRCRHMGYSFRLAARVILYASSHRQDNTYHYRCYSSRGALFGTKNSSMGSPRRIDPTTHRTMSERSYHAASTEYITSMVSNYVPL